MPETRADPDDTDGWGIADPARWVRAALRNGARITARVGGWVDLELPDGRAMLAREDVYQRAIAPRPQRPD